MALKGFVKKGQTGVSVVDHWPIFRQQIKALTENRVLVGIPESTTDREAQPGEPKTPITNAGIGLVMEKGSPAANIPPRPWLVPGIESIEKKIAERFQKAAEAALDGDMQAVKKGLESIGLMAQSAVREKIRSGPFQPLAESTLRARARRRAGTNRGFWAGVELERRAQGELPSTEYAQPLIDTGAFVRAVNYVIRKRGGVNGSSP